MEKNEKIEILKRWLESGESSFDDEKSSLLISKLHEMNDSQLDTIFKIYQENTASQQQETVKNVNQTIETMESEIYKRKFSISEMLATAWDSYFNNFNTFILVVLATYVPLNIINFIYSAYVPEDELAELIKDYNLNVIAYTIMIFLTSFILVSIATIATAFIVQEDINNKNINFMQAINKSFNRLSTYMLTGLMMGIFLGFLFILIIPGIIVGIFWIFALTSVALRNQSGMKALEYSKSIVDGRWWPVFGYALSFIVLSFLASFFIGLIFGFVYTVFGESVILDFILSSIISFITLYFTVVYVVFFINFDATKKPLS